MIRPNKESGEYLNCMRSFSKCQISSVDCHSFGPKFGNIQRRTNMQAMNYFLLESLSRRLQGRLALFLTIATPSD